MTSEQSAPAEFGIAGAASKLEAMLNDDYTVSETPVQTTRDEAPVTKASKEAEALEPEAEAETKPTDGAEEAPAEEAKAEEPAEEVEEADKNQPAEPFYTVKIDGKEEKVPLSELLQGYSRTGDYTRKTQALAAERKAADEAIAQLNAERAQYAQLLPALKQQLKTGVAEPDWQKLYSENPAEFAAQKALWDLHQEKVRAVEAENARVNQALQAEQTRDRERKAAEGRKVLLEEFPEWKNPEKWEADRVKLIDRLYSRHSLNDQEVAVVTLYPTILSDMQKARMWDDYQAKRAKPAAAQSANSPAPASAGSAAASPKQTSELTRAKQRLAQTGHVKDAAILFEDFV